MDALVQLLVAGLALVAMATPIVALIALVRASRVQRRLAGLERELRRPRGGPAGEVPAPTPATGLSPGGEPPGPEVAAPAPAAPIAPAAPAEVAPPAARVGPAPAPRPAKERRARRKIEWERFVGVRGAAVVGGIVFAVAGIMFFKEAFERGWITPQMRILVGALAGVIAIALAELVRARDFRFAPGALAGAGVVVLYATIWGAYRRYEMIPIVTAFPLMVLVTAACCWLAVRQRSQIVAVLGLIGGFATPQLLAEDVASPVGLFGYILLLDLGLLAIGQRMRWSSLGLLGMAGTFLIELLWVADDLEQALLPIGLASLGLFGVVFAVAGRFAPQAQRARWLASQAGALLLPFLFAVYFAAHADLGQHLYPIALMLAALSAGASWVGRAQRAPWLPIGAAAGGVAIVATWTIQTGHLTGALAWELVLCSLGLALTFQLVAEWRAWRALPCSRLDRLPPIAAAGGLLVVFALSAGGASGAVPWPWLAGALMLGAIPYRIGRDEDLALVRAAGPFGAGCAVALYLLAHARRPPAEFPAAWVISLVLVGFAALLLAAAGANRRAAFEAPKRAAWHAAAAFAVPVLTALAPLHLYLDSGAPLALGTMLALGLAIALAANGVGRGAWLVVAVLLCAVAQGGWFGAFLGSPDPLDAPVTPFALGLASALAFTFWPALFRTQLALSRACWRAAALAAPLWFPSLSAIVDEHGGEGWAFALPLGLALALAGALRLGLRPHAHEQPAARRVALVWLGAAAIGFAALVLPLHLDRHVSLTSPALFGAGLVALWRRVDHPGLKYLTLVLSAFAALGVVAGLAQPDGYETSSRVLVNWMSWGTLVPAASLLFAALVLHPLEVERARPFERVIYKGGRPLASGLCGLACVAVVFAWINLSIYDWFSAADESHLRLDFRRYPARDLSLSIAWTVYALALLAIGMAKRLSGLRWVSLAVLVVALGKVFLHDLGQLEGLYRVFSLSGLGISLLVVSLLYQRFVFPRGEPEEAE